LFEFEWRVAKVARHFWLLC